MPTSNINAIDEMFAAFQTAWSAGTTAIVGYIPLIKWDGIDDGTIPDANKFWVRVSTQQVDSRQATLCENVVTHGSRRYETNGVIFVQLFAPKRKDSMEKAKLLCALVQNTFRKSTTNVIIRNARIQDLPSDNGAIRKNVVAEYQFDEIN